MEFFHTHGYFRHQSVQFFLAQNHINSYAQHLLVGLDDLNKSEISTDHGVSTAPFIGLLHRTEIGVLSQKCTAIVGSIHCHHSSVDFVDNDLIIWIAQINLDHQIQFVAVTS